MVRLLAVPFQSVEERVPTLGYALPYNIIKLLSLLKGRANHENKLSETGANELSSHYFRSFGRSPIASTIAHIFIGFPLFGWPI